MEEYLNSIKSLSFSYCDDCVLARYTDDKNDTWINGHLNLSKLELKLPSGYSVNLINCSSNDKCCNDPDDVKIVVENKEYVLEEWNGNDESCT